MFRKYREHKVGSFNVLTMDCVVPNHCSDDTTCVYTSELSQWTESVLNFAARVLCLFLVEAWKTVSL